MAPESALPLPNLAILRGNQLEGDRVQQGKPMTSSHRPTDRPSRTATRLQGGIGAGTPVLTLDGYLPVEYLTPGDRIVTRAGARTLSDVSWRLAMGPVILVPSSAIGHGLPRRDVIVARNQTILVRDWRARTLYGADEALVPAERMADGGTIRAINRPDLRLFTLSFPDLAVIYAGEVELGCIPARVTA